MMNPPPKHDGPATNLGARQLGTRFNGQRLTHVGIALLDWWTKSYISQGFLYPFPVMLAAGFLNLWAIAILGATFVLLAERLLAHHSYLYRLGGAARI